MKQGTKTILGVAGIVFALGIFLWLIGLMMGGRNESLVSFQGVNLGEVSVSPSGIHIGGKNGIHVTSDGVDIGGEHGLHVGAGGIYMSGLEQEMILGDTQMVEQENLGNFTSIDVAMDLGDIWVEEGETSSVSMSWNLKNYTVDCWVEDGVLTIRDQSERKQNNNGQSVSVKVILTLPAEMKLDEMALGTAFGNIHADAEIVAKTVNLETNLGDITSIGLVAEWLDAETDLGEVNITFLGRENVSYTLETDLGEVQVDGKSHGRFFDGGAADGQYTVYAKSSLGNISLRFEE